MTEQHGSLDPARSDAPSPTAASGGLDRLLRDSPDVVGFLQQLAALSAALVPESSCGVVMHRGNSLTTVASSDNFAIELAEIEQAQSRGPCGQALRTGETVTVPDLATDDRWGEYRLQALGAGLRSCVSLPLSVDDVPVGALALYSREPDHFTGAVLRPARFLTLQAANALTLLLHGVRPPGSPATVGEADVEELRIELDEAREMLRTIRAGGFDALVIDSAGAARQRPATAEGRGGGDGESPPAPGSAGRNESEHRWYRLVSLDSFTAGCPCGWVSPERDTAEEMMRDVERHLDEVRRARPANA